MNRQCVTTPGTRRGRLSTLIALVAIGYVSTALAASDPSIPPGFLAYPPYNEFIFEATHLFPSRQDSLNLVEDGEYWIPYELRLELLVGNPHRPTDEALQKAATLTAVPEPLKAEFAAMQSATTGDDAYHIGKDLPEAIRLYTAAAVDFRIARPTSITWQQGLYESRPEPGPMDAEQRAALDRAIGRFQAVLRLPGGQTVPRAVMAAYMLGRCYAMRGLPGDLTEAEKAFALTRTLARSGLPDQDGLAIASFGEQARLRRAQGDLASTVDLYAEQAARASGEGVDSLEWVAQALFDDPEAMARAENLPRVQRLLIDYALMANDDGSLESLIYEHSTQSSDQGHLYRPEGITPILQIAKRWPREKIAWPDRLAALAYRAGDIDFARSLVQDQDSGLAWWIRAKLFLADGQLADAEAAYHKIFEAPSTSEDLGRLTTASSLGACVEMVQLERARGEFVPAMRDALVCDKRDSTFADPYSRLPNPLFYIAERVLTTQELKDFVDAQPNVDPQPEKNHPREPVTSYERDQIGLRSMLASRLVREGRIAEAIPYADIEAGGDPYSEWDTGLSKKLRTQRDLIQAYGEAQQQSLHAATNVEKAAGWYQQALLIRLRDSAITGHSSPLYTDQAKPPFPGVSSSELARLKSNYTVPDQDNLHWYIAYDDAMRAAALVPARSQAYAAILCHAAYWMYQAPPVGTHDPAPAFKEAWRLYLKNGAYTPWAKSFGHRCPDPDFAGAASPAWRREVNVLHARVNRHVPLAISLLALLVLGGISAIVWRVVSAKGSSQSKPVAR
jgi:cellulose synthase operon protein C